mmetsp:Transcript_917/g.1112  ORF Transcript_917/g.1112 Transcript_917/m.1112 type:complete len:688 (+) Transcript_917:240-2303(+)|eukprot:CAMPEP_0184028648 /NCGR_PEP_ID=MMETSP0954-20121128/14965_1 /TAXON_ID=627963 /ORGANISM="Aplanochytrium sp, Strain PBS07" /LENGTH=687 /DNA_ID=CAMNT_0026313531 /DNA_START=178 /DNA_END=2241 /DNA_ORIENTATION=-
MALKYKITCLLLLLCASRTIATPNANTVVKIKNQNEYIKIFGQESTDGVPIEDNEISQALLYFPVNGTETEQGACTDVPPPGTNSSFVLVAKRGGCTFSQKIIEAEAIGAVGVLILNQESSLLRNGSEIVENPCDIDCELASSTDRNSCELDSGCPSSYCLLSADLEYCCLDDDLRDIPLLFTGSNLTDVGIPVVFVSVTDSDDVLQLLNSTSELFVFISERETNPWDGTMWIILFTGTLVTAFASYRAVRPERAEISWIWGGSKRAKAEESISVENSAVELDYPEPVAENEDAKKTDSKEKFDYDKEDNTLEQVELTTGQGLCLIIAASCGLVGMFFAVRYYPTQVVFGIVVLYGISAIYSTQYFIFTPLFRYVLPNPVGFYVLRLGNYAREFFGGDVRVYDVFGFLVSLTLVVIWLVFRHEPEVWILQNLFSFSLAMMFLATIRLTRFQTAFWVLLAFLVYDFFMVFITPFFGNGESVMLQVATAGAGFEEITSNQTECNRVETERMPMLFLAPRFDYRGGFGLLGLGDIMLPGLFITYVLRVDYIRANTWIFNVEKKRKAEFEEPTGFNLRKFLKVHYYFFPVCIAYFLALLFTISANIFEWQINGVRGQPALIYLVPACLGTFMVMAKRKNELHLYWKYELDRLNPNNYIYEENEDEISGNDKPNGVSDNDEEEDKDDDKDGV